MLCTQHACDLHLLHISTTCWQRYNMPDTHTLNNAFQALTTVEFLLASLVGNSRRRARERRAAVAQRPSDGKFVSATLFSRAVSNAYVGA